jgi:hypothetical protein
MTTSIGGITFDECSGPHSKRAKGVVVVGNPGGGEPGAVTVPDRSMPIHMQFRGAFNPASLPDPFALIGTVVSVVVYAQTKSYLCTGAQIVDQRGVVNVTTSSSSAFITVNFELYPVA